MNIIGDVEGKTCILFDDMVDTAGSLCNAADAIKTVGKAKTVYACASHGVLSRNATQRIEDSCIEEMMLPYLMALLFILLVGKDRRHPAAMGKFYKQQ